MPELSVIEFGVYGLFAYSSVLVLIVSVLKDTPTGKSGSLARVIWLTPGAIFCLVLAMTVTDITLQDSTNVITNLNTTEVWTEQITHTINLVNPIWVIIHFMLFIIIVIYILFNVLDLFTKL